MNPSMTLFKSVESLVGRMHAKFVMGSAFIPRSSSKKLADHYDLEDTWVCLLSAENGLESTSRCLSATHEGALIDALDCMIQAFHKSGLDRFVKIQDIVPLPLEVKKCTKGRTPLSKGFAKPRVIGTPELTHSTNIFHKTQKVTR